PQVLHTHGSLSVGSLSVSTFRSSPTRSVGLATTHRLRPHALFLHTGSSAPHRGECDSRGQGVVYILEVYIRQVNEHSLVGLEVAWRRPLIPLVLNGKGCPTDTIVVHIGRVSSIATGRHRVRFGYDPLVDAIAPGVQPNIERKARKNPPFDLNP